MVSSLPEYFEVAGAVHVHSSFSDGSKSVEEIAQIANQKNLDFLMFSDHNTLQPKLEGMEGWHDNVLVMIGAEYNDRDNRNHYLAFRINENIEKREHASDYVQQVREKGGFGVIAHPAEKRSFSDAYPPYPWTDWDVEGFDGIEIWNQMSEWMEGITYANFFWRLIHPLRSIRYPAWETLERWDKYNRTRRVVGMGGIDVHGFPFKLLGFIPFEIYPYKVQFRSIRTHLLLEQPFTQNGNPVSFEKAEDTVFEAIRSARCFMSNFAVGDACGFRFQAAAGNNTYPMGSRLPVSSKVLLSVKVPLRGKIRMIKDGHLIQAVKGTSLEISVNESGVYRVEVYRKHRGWIYSNPIVLYSV